MTGFRKRDTTTKNFQKNITIELQYENALEAIRLLQKRYSFMTICGSYTLMITGKLSVRLATDVDFSINEKHLEILRLDSNLSIFSEDKYTREINRKDKYKSYHGIYTLPDYEEVSVNFLVFEDDIDIESTIITDGIFHYKSQPIDTVMKWKHKYNRTKDKEDLNKIANKELESILAK